METQRCIYRKVYGQGIKCKCKAKKNKKFCKSHLDLDYHLFDIMDECIIDNVIKTETGLYRIWQHINHNNTYHINDTDCKTFDNTNNNKYKIFFTILDYLFSKNRLINIIHCSFYYNYSKKVYESKKVIIRNLFQIFENTYNISLKENVNEKITKIQKVFRGYLYRKLVQYNKYKSENDCDPFTFDNINEIPYYLKISYKDENEHIYTYNILEFQHFLKTNGMWNPYTRENISNDIWIKIRLLMHYHNLNTIEKKCIWITESQAYTELSQYMEKAGFYNNVSWFQKISYNNCKNIIRIYRLLCKNIENSRNFFPLCFELHEDRYVFDFCEEAIKLFENADDHFLICCNFVKALAFNIEDFFNNIPNWMTNIESSINIESSMNNELHTYTYMYIYDFLSNFP